uniref:Uncharacterized protein n=1 Tax=Caenorhabditis japonica TaxID=281687 RepID=A0A8R1EUX1_CAEJA
MVRELANVSCSKQVRDYCLLSLQAWNDKDTKFTIGGATVPITSRIRDLGMFFTSDLSFSNHIDTVLRKAHQRVNIFSMCSVMRVSTLSSNVSLFM